ncbi:MAG TPA: Ig-like domain-containing protein [Vicinamibacterales bacterium]|nr:Ig-like domain-containing protein [Vicinamibacterales bacterium]
MKARQVWCSSSMVLGLAFAAITGLAAQSNKAPVVVALELNGAAVESQQIRVAVKVSSPAPDTGVPTGLVELFDGDASLAGGPLSSDGNLVTCSLQITLTRGAHVLTARYQGDGSFAQQASTPVSVFVTAPQ